MGDWICTVWEWHDQVRRQLCSATTTHGSNAAVLSLGGASKTDQKDVLEISGIALWNAQISSRPPHLVS